MGRRMNSKKSSMNREILGIITAKGHSQRLPNKNMTPLAGHPLVWWTIRAAKQSKIISRIVLTSDDENILAFAQEEGVDTIKRPKKLCQPATSSESVIHHTLMHMQKKEGYNPEIFVLLQPTSPLRTGQDIDKALKYFFKRQCTALVSGYPFKKDPKKEFMIDDNEYLNFYMEAPFLNNKVPRFFKPNGAIYINNTSIFMENKSIMTNQTIPFFMKKEKSIDIDYLEDLVKAEKILLKKIK